MVSIQAQPEHNLDIRLGDLQSWINPEKSQIISKIYKLWLERKPYSKCSQTRIYKGEHFITEEVHILSPLIKHVSYCCDEGNEREQR